MPAVICYCRNCVRGEAPCLVEVRLNKPPPEEARYAVLPCPKCGRLHVDRGEFAERLHHTHLCEHCGSVFRIEPYTFGIEGPLQEVKGG